MADVAQMVEPLKYMTSLAQSLYLLNKDTNSNKTADPGS